MIDHPSRTTGPRHRVCRGLDVAGQLVDVAFDDASEGEATSSAGARLAEDLVAARIGCERRLVHVGALMPSGRPAATVHGRESRMFVSVSHGGGLVGAAICATGGVGLDIVDATKAGPSLEAWFTTDERAMLRGGDDGLRARLWAAKEAAFKAARIDEGFRPFAVGIEQLRAAGFRWCVQGDHRRMSGQGVFTTVGRQVVAVAVEADSMNVEHQSRSA